MNEPLTKEQQAALGRMIVEGLKRYNPEMVRGCLSRPGVDPNVAVQENDSGAYRPILHWAAYYFITDCAQALMDGGADIEARDEQGDTALFFAIRSFRIEGVKFLMKHGADPLAQNKSGAVAMDVARQLSPGDARDKIIQALAVSYVPPPGKEQRREKNDGNEVNAVSTPENITVMKPLQLRPVSPAGGRKGFTL